MLVLQQARHGNYLQRRRLFRLTYSDKVLHGFTSHLVRCWDSDPLDNQHPDVTCDFRDQQVSAWTAGEEGP